MCWLLVGMWLISLLYGFMFVLVGWFWIIMVIVLLFLGSICFFRYSGLLFMLVCVEVVNMLIFIGMFGMVVVFLLVLFM